MAENNTTEPVLVQTFDRSEVREYIKVYPHAFWSSEEVVRKDSIKTELVLEIQCRKTPDKIIFNGTRVTLSPYKEQ